MLQINREAAIAAYFGATGCGKSHEMKARLAERQDPRLIVVDPDGEYPIATRLSSLQSLERATTGEFWRISFVPSPDREIGVAQFDYLCRLVWERARQRGSCCLAVDELADFTEANRAPRWWSRIIRRGRKHGISIFAASQLPTDVDKKIYSNASRIRTGRLNEYDHQVRLAKALNVPVADVARLQGFQYLERDRNTGELATDLPPLEATQPAVRT